MRRTLLLVVAAVAACGHTPAGTSPTAKPGPSKEWNLPAGDVTLHLRAVGGHDGSPVLIVVHGGPGLSHEYMTALDRLAGPDRRVVYYDQRGCGLSSTPVTGRWGPDAMSADIDAVRAALGADKIDLLGHSWGGLPAMAYAVRHPDRVAHLILVDSLPPTERELGASAERFDQRRRKLIEDKVIVEEMAKPLGDDCSARLAARLPVYFSDPHHPAMAALKAHCSINAGQESWKSMGHDWDLRAKLRALRVPTLAVTGADDPFGAEMTRATADAIPGARFVSLPKCGHFPFLECAAPFFAAVKEFLAR